jgi:hypothetical protein
MFKFIYLGFIFGFVFGLLPAGIVDSVSGGNVAILEFHAKVVTIFQPIIESVYQLFVSLINTITG